MNKNQARGGGDCYFLQVARYYHNLKLNVTHISPLVMAGRRAGEDVLKSPSHRWERFGGERQTLSDLQSHDWEKATGLGVVLGFGDLRALDIDGCLDDTVLAEILYRLGLDGNYEWAVRSGSHKGYHIILRCGNHSFPTHEGKVKAFLPDSWNWGRFERLELRWQAHLVLPPSLHSSGKRYEFCRGKFPVSEPVRVDVADVETCVKMLCGCAGFAAEDLVDAASGDHLDGRPTYGEPRLAETSEDLLDVEEGLPKRGFCLVIDTETTGLPQGREVSLSRLTIWPRLVQLAWLLYDGLGNRISWGNYIIRPDGFSIPDSAARIHGISTQRAKREGSDLRTVLREFGKAVEQAEYIVAHNVEFDSKVIRAEFMRLGLGDILKNKRQICTMKSSAAFCGIPGPFGSKWPTFAELHRKLFGCRFEGEHNAGVDVVATAQSFWELKRRGIIG